MEHNGKYYDLQAVLFGEECDGCAFADGYCQDVVGHECEDGGVFIWLEVEE